MAVVPKQNFLFFLCNFQGQCYYLDKLGNVQLGNLSSGQDLSLPDSPANWMEIEYSWVRSQKYWGYIRSFSPDIKFVKKTAKLIRKLYYSKGIEQQIYFIVSKWNDVTGIYELEYKAELDFSQIVGDNPVEGITIKTLEGGILKIFKAYENTIFEIPCDGSIPENLRLNINGIMFKAIFNYEIMPFTPTTKGTTIPLIFTTEQGNNVGIAKGDQIFSTFTDTTSNINPTVTNTGKYFFNSVRAIQAIAISGEIQTAGTFTTGRLFILFSDGSPQFDVIPVQTFGANTYAFTKTFSINAGSQAYLCFEETGSTEGAILQGKYFLQFDSQFEDTECYVIKPFDVFKILLDKICKQASEPGHNILYTPQSNILKQYANLCLTSGSALRQEVGSVIKLSLAQLFDIYNPILNCCLGTTQDGVLFIEDKGYVFDSSKNDIDLGEVAHLQITPAMDLYFDKINVGYREQKYDNKEGNNEYNTTSQYKSPIKKVVKDLDLVCKARADSYGVEYTRFLISTNNTSNNKSDSDIFVLNIDLSQTTKTDVSVKGDITNTVVSGITYHGIGYGVHPAPMLNWPIEYTGITGTDIKNEFALIPWSFGTPSIQYPNTQIQFSANEAGYIPFKGQANISFIATGLQVISPIPHYDPYNTALITDGRWAIEWEIKLNDTIIATHLVRFNLGDSITIVIPFDVRMQFGDRLWIDWHIGEQSYNPTTDEYTISSGIYNGKTVLAQGFTGHFQNINLTLNSEFTAPVYSLLRKTYDEITAPGINTDFAYNIEDLTPSRMLAKWYNWIVSTLGTMPDKNLTFQTSDKNHNLTTTLNGLTFQEGSNIPISKINQNKLFLPYYLEFDTKIPATFEQTMTAARNAHIHFTYYGVDYYMFGQEVKSKPALSSSQHWKGLASPVNDINNFIDIDLSGINLLNLKNMDSFYSHLNPIKAYPLGIDKDPKFNFIHMDENFFINQVNYWAQKKDYYQPWQKNDVTPIQILTKGIGPAKIDIYSPEPSFVPGTATIFDYDFTNNKTVDPSILQVDSNGNNNTFAAGISGFTFGLVPPAKTGTTNQIVLSPSIPAILPLGTYTMTIGLPVKPNNGIATLEILGNTTFEDHALVQGLNTFTFTFTEDVFLFLDFTCPSAESALFVLADWKCTGPTMIKSDVTLVETINMTQKSDSAIVSPMVLFEANINWSTFAEGVYWCVFTIGVGGTIDQFISEAQWIKTSWPDTLLFQYKNSINKLSTIFSTGFSPCYRVEGKISDYKAKTHIAAFEDQPGDMKLLNSIPFGTHVLQIGRAWGVPPWVMRLLNMIMGLDTVFIDGLEFTRAEQDTDWEVIRLEKWPLSYYTLEIREAENEQGVSVGTTGNINNEILVTYQVNQKGFGEKIGNDNIVPIIKVE